MRALRLRSPRPSKGRKDFLHERMKKRLKIRKQLPLSLNHFVYFLYI